MGTLTRFIVTYYTLGNCQCHTWVNALDSKQAMRIVAKRKDVAVVANVKQAI